MAKTSSNFYRILMRMSVVGLTILFIAIGLVVDNVKVSGGYKNYSVDTGIYTINGLQKEERQTGIKLDHVLLFHNVQDLDFSKLKPYLDENKQVILNIEFVDDHANLAEVANGNYDNIYNHSPTHSKKTEELYGYAHCMNLMATGITGAYTTRGIISKILFPHIGMLFLLLSKMVHRQNFSLTTTGLTGAIRLQVLHSAIFIRVMSGSIWS